MPLKYGLAALEILYIALDLCRKQVQENISQYCRPEMPNKSLL